MSDLSMEDRLLAVAYALATEEERREQRTLALTTGKGSLDRSPRKNWVEKTGKLPRYIERIALALERKGMPLSVAIPTAINRVKKWASGVGDVNADTRARAAKAVAEWEALKARNRARVAKNKIKGAAKND